MAHIDLPKGLPGITAALSFSPDTAKPLCELADVLLHAPNTLSQGERELIATYVSYLNRCFFCQASHGAVAARHLGNSEAVNCVRIGLWTSAPISNKVKYLLPIARQVYRSGKAVNRASIEAARENGATDKEIHDTILIAAAFCMYNRYVDGLGTWQPHDGEIYLKMGKKIAVSGYWNPDIEEGLRRRQES